MQQESSISSAPSEAQEYSAYLKRMEKVNDWFWGIYILACLSLFVAGSIILL